MLQHLKNHKTLYIIGAILIAFVGSAVVYNRVPNFEGLTASLTGDITTVGGLDSELELLSPNGGEMFVSGDIMVIQWEDSGNSARYHLFLLPSESNQGRTNKDEKVIVKNVRGLNYEWRIPIYVKGQFKIGIKSAASGIDISDTYFTVIRNGTIESAHQ